MLFGVPGGALSQEKDPISLLYTLNYSTHHDRTDSTSHNWLFNLGSAGYNKMVVIGISWESSDDGGTSYLSSVTLGGSTMTQIGTASEPGIHSSLYMYETSATSAWLTVVLGGTSSILASRMGVYMQALDKASPIKLQSFDTQSTTVTGTQLSTDIYLKKGQAVVVNTTGNNWDSTSSYNHSELGGGTYEDRVDIGNESSATTGSTQLTHAYINNSSAKTITYTTENMTGYKSLCAASFV